MPKTIMAKEATKTQKYDLDSSIVLANISRSRLPRC